MKIVKIPYSGHPRDNFYIWIRQNYLPEIAVQIQEAWIFAVRHQGLVKRRDETTVLSHLKSVARYMHNWGFSFKYLIAALLHDLIEDCPTVKLSHVEEAFGDEVARMVDFMSRNILDADISYNHKVDRYLLTSPGFIFLRLADQLHNILNFEGYRSFQSMLENCHEILNNLKKADLILNKRLDLQNNKQLMHDLSLLRSLATKHLTD